MKKTSKVFILIVMLVMITSCSTKTIRDHDQFKVSNDDEIVDIETSVGKFKIKLLKDSAPNQVENFKDKVKNGELIGMEFNYKLPNRTATAYAGDKNLKNNDVQIKDKINPKYYLFQGAVFIPRFAENGDAFFDGLSFGIVTNQGVNSEDAKKINTKLQDDEAQLFEKYNGEVKSQGRLVIFGQVIDGFDTLTKIDKSEEKILIISTKLGG